MPEITTSAPFIDVASADSLIADLVNATLSSITTNNDISISVPVSITISVWSSNYISYQLSFEATGSLINDSGLELQNISMNGSVGPIHFPGRALTTFIFVRKILIKPMSLVITCPPKQLLTGPAIEFLTRKCSSNPAKPIVIVYSIFIKSSFLMFFGFRPVISNSVEFGCPEKLQVALKQISTASRLLRIFI